MLTREERSGQATRRLFEAQGAKEKLNLAFKKLRKMGFIAKQSFMCCNSCGSATIAHELNEHLDKGGKKPLGAVFYCRQVGLIQRDGQRQYASKLNLQFGSISTGKHGEVGLPTEEVGAQVVKVLESFGLFVNWNGDPNESIEVDPCPRLWEGRTLSRFERVD